MKTTLKDHPSRPDRVIVESSVQAEFERANVEGIARYRAAVEACSTPAEVRRVPADVLPENRWSATHGYFAEMTTGPKHRRGTYYLGIAQVNGCGEREAGTRRWALCDPRGKLLQSRAALEEATLRDLGPLPAPCGLILDRTGEPAFRPDLATRPSPRQGRGCSPQTARSARGSAGGPSCRRSPPSEMSAPRWASRSSLASPASRNGLRVTHD